MFSSIYTSMSGLVAYSRGLDVMSPSGRVISFLEVDELPQILVRVKVMEIDRAQARNVMRFIKGLMLENDLLCQLVEREGESFLDLSNNKGIWVLCEAPAPVIASKNSSKSGPT